MINLSEMTMNRAIEIASCEQSKVFEELNYENEAKVFLLLCCLLKSGYSTIDIWSGYCAYAKWVNGLNKL